MIIQKITRKGIPMSRKRNMLRKKRDKEKIMSRVWTGMYLTTTLKGMMTQTIMNPKLTR